MNSGLKNIQKRGVVSLKLRRKSPTETFQIMRNGKLPSMTVL